MRQIEFIFLEYDVVILFINKQAEGANKCGN